MGEKKPLVSIITGYYNRENYVDESIQSLCEQTYQNIEIIIFDDCSTDNTYEKLKVFADIDPRIKLIRNTNNRGFVKSLIDAVDEAKGEFIAIHGSGDYSYPTRIERQVDVLMKNEKVGVVGCFYNNINLTIENESQIIESRTVLTGDLSQILLEGCPFSHGEVMYRKSIYNKVGGYRDYFTFAQDYDLWSRMCFFCEFKTVEELLYHRYYLNDGASVKPEKKILQLLYSLQIKEYLRFRLNGKKDLIELYGTNAAFFFNFDKKVIKALYNEGLRFVRLYGQSNTYINDIFKTFSKKSQSVPLKILNLYFNVFPEKLSQKLARNRILLKMIYELLIK